MSSKDYIPSNDAAFDQWFKFMCQYVNQKCTSAPPAWDHIPAEARTVLDNAYETWYTAYSAYLGPHTKVDTEAKNDAKAAAKAVIRPFVNRYLRFPPVTDEDRTAMNIRNKDIKPTPVPAPEDVPEIEVTTPLPRTLRFRFRRANAKHWSKPAGVHGFECLWVLADTAPMEIDELLHSAFASRNPLELVFKESERGRRVYFAVRWETNTVKKGPWSEIFSAIVP